jgi:hypothetical protein
MYRFICIRTCTCTFICIGVYIYKIRPAQSSHASRNGKPACMYMDMYVYMYVYMYIESALTRFSQLQACVYVCGYVCVYVCVYVYRIGPHTLACMFVDMHIYMYVYMYMYIESALTRFSQATLVSSLRAYT